MKFVFVFGILCLIAVAVDSQIGEYCEADRDCKGVEACMNHKCEALYLLPEKRGGVETCNETDDCPHNFECLDGVCGPCLDCICPPSRTKRQVMICNETTDCPSKFECLDGVCGPCLDCVCDRSREKRQVETCNINDDCQPNFECLDGVCVPCIDGICIPSREKRQVKTCEISTDCPMPLLQQCIEGLCVPPICQTSADCEPGLECINHLCMPKKET